MRRWADRQTDGQTDRQTDRQTVNFVLCAFVHMSNSGKGTVER